MALVAILNLIGLTLTVVAALLMWYFPPRVASYNENGAQFVQWTNAPKPEKVKVGKLHARLARFAPLVLALGFLLQLPSAIAALMPATPAS